MRGSIRKRFKGSWNLILDIGVEINAETGARKRKQKYITFRGTRKQAEAKLAELVNTANGGVFVEPSKMTLGQWLREWLDAVVKLRRRPATYTRYQGIIDNNILTAPIASIPLQKLRPTHLEAYYATAVSREGAGLSASTVAVHHAILHRALRKAKKDNLVVTNVAADLDGKPHVNRHRTDAQLHCWTADEARAFLAATRAALLTAYPRVAARFLTALSVVIMTFLLEHLDLLL